MNDTPNVIEHAPLSAGASDAQPPQPAPTGHQEHGGADRGCCVSPCSLSSLATDEQALKAYRWMESMFMRGEPLSIQTLYQEGEADIQIHLEGRGALRFIPRKNLAWGVTHYCERRNLAIDLFASTGDATTLEGGAPSDRTSVSAILGGVSTPTQDGSETPSTL